MTFPPLHAPPTHMTGNFALATSPNASDHWRNPFPGRVDPSLYTGTPEVGPGRSEQVLSPTVPGTF